jgi:hypothetical protein
VQLICNLIELISLGFTPSIVSQNSVLSPSYRSLCTDELLSETVVNTLPKVMPTPKSTPP